MSRLRLNNTVFDVFVELAAPPNINDVPFLLWKYPEDYADERIMKSILEFSFPCEISAEAVQLFSFVLTNEESRYTFGYCRHTPRTKTCLCILSSLPWHELFYKLLNHVADVIVNGKESEVEGLLVNAYHQEVPLPGQSFAVESSLGQNKLECVCPDHTKLPRIPDNRNLTEYYNAVSEDTMMRVFARCVDSVWVDVNYVNRGERLGSEIHTPIHLRQHIFIPVLPIKLFNYLSAPMPFLIGVPSCSMEKASREIDLGEVVIVDLDNKSYRSLFDDLEELPSEVVAVLKRNLRASNHLLGDGVSRSFLRALVVLIGGYREALQFRPGESITFNHELFVTSRPLTLRPFLEKMLHFQIFRQFIEDRLDQLNTGQGIRDDFEEECCLYSGNEFSKFKYQYQEWRDNMKKEGLAIVSTLQKRANPAIQQAYLSVAKRGKEAIKDFKSRISEMKDESPQFPVRNVGGAQITRFIPGSVGKRGYSRSMKSKEWHDDRDTGHGSIEEYADEAVEEENVGVEDRVNGDAVMPSTTIEHKNRKLPFAHKMKTSKSYGELVSDSLSSKEASDPDFPFLTHVSDKEHTNHTAFTQGSGSIAPSRSDYGVSSVSPSSGLKGPHSAESGNDNNSDHLIDFGLPGLVTACAEAKLGNLNLDDIEFDPLKVVSASSGPVKQVVTPAPRTDNNDVILGPRICPPRRPHKPAHLRSRPIGTSSVLENRTQSVPQSLLDLGINQDPVKTFGQPQTQPRSNWESFE